MTPLMLEVRPCPVTLSADDLDGVASRYECMLEFATVDCKSCPAFGTRLVFSEHQRFRVELSTTMVVRRPRAGTPGHMIIRGVSQIAFEVLDIDAAYRALRDRGAQLSWELQRYADLGLAIFFVRAP